MQTLRVGVLGAGRATRELTLLAFQHVSGGKLVSVCDPEIETARRIALENKLTAHANLEDMVRAEKVDVVIVNTPVQTHAELAIRAMRAGCHVVIEKPAVAHLRELEDIRRVAEETNRKWTVVHNYKYYEGPQKALQMYKQGILGEIIHVDRYWMTPPQEDRMERNPEGWWHKANGGRLADALPHFLYLPYMFVGPMELVSVSARKLANDRPWSFCDESDIVLRTPRAYVNLRQSTNQESWPYRGYIYLTILYGTKLSVFTDHHNAEIIWEHSNKRNLRKGLEAVFAILKRRLLPNRKPVVSRGAHNILYEKFFEYVRGLGSNPSPWEEIVNVATLSQQIAEGMNECVESGRKAICPARFVEIHL